MINGVCSTEPFYFLDYVDLWGWNNFNSFLCYLNINNLDNNFAFSVTITVFQQIVSLLTDLIPPTHQISIIRSIHLDLKKTFLVEILSYNYK